MGMIDGLSAMVKRAVVRLVDDARKVQTMQVSLLAGELAEDVEHMQPYGVSFVPPDGSEAVALSVNGDSSHVLVLGAQRRDDRPTGETDAGSGGLYCLGEWKVYINAADGTLHLGAKAPSDWVALAGPTKAELDDVKADLDALRAWLATHTHGGVTTGGGSTAVPGSLGTLPTAHTPGSVASTVVRCE